MSDDLERIRSLMEARSAELRAMRALRAEMAAKEARIAELDAMLDARMGGLIVQALKEKP